MIWMSLHGTAWWAKYSPRPTCALGVKRMSPVSAMWLLLRHGLPWHRGIERQHDMISMSLHCTAWWRAWAK